MSTGAPVRVDQEAGGVVVITLDRPAVANALDLPGVEALATQLARLGSDPAARVIILTGSGRAFCAGLDLAAADAEQDADPDVADRLAIQERFSGLVAEVRRARIPVVAAVNGPAAGAGFALALAADVRLASTGARFVPAAIGLGLSSGECGTSYLLPRLIGASAAFEILLTGRVLDAAEAKDLRLVSVVSADREALMADASALAHTIAGLPRLAVEQTKRVLQASLEAPSFGAAVHLENLTQVLTGMSADSKEAMRSFAERRRAGSGPSGS